MIETTKPFYFKYTGKDFSPDSLPHFDTFYIRHAPSQQRTTIIREKLIDGLKNGTIPLEGLELEEIVLYQGNFGYNLRRK
ncbi:MAG: hypothetical protein AABX73_01235 [Nanoarchaeota archaeon]